METSIEGFLADAEVDREGRIAMLSTFFNHLTPRLALKQCLIGIARKNMNGLSWESPSEEFKEFLTTHKVSADRNDKSLQRFALSVSTPRDVRTVPYMGLWCIHVMEKNPLLRNNLGCQQGLELFDFTTPVTEFLRTGDTYVLEMKEGKGIQTGPAHLAKALRRLLQIKDDDMGKIARGFFESVEDQWLALKDKSYYALYRYSTEARDIVKTFLVITPPGVGHFDLFRFTHIYKTRAGLRIARGAVVGFEESAYLFGTGAKKLRGGMTEAPQGMKVIALSLADLRHDYRMVPGVFLSNALKWQPIIGRVVLVHIGFSSEVGELTDTQVRPRVIKADESLEADIRSTIIRKKGSNADKNPKAIAEYIRTYIQNSTAYDRKNARRVIGLRALPIEDLLMPVP